MIITVNQHILTVLITIMTVLIMLITMACTIHTAQAMGLTAEEIPKSLGEATD